MAGTDLFAGIGALWTKARPETMPSFFIMHRFMASDPDLAAAAKVLQRDIKDPEMLRAVWQGLLPKGRGAPKGLTYVGATKTPAADALTEKMMKTLPERRDAVEQIIELFELAGLTKELYAYFGIELPKENK